MKAKVSLKLNSLSIPEKVGFARTVVTKMTGNASFPDPRPKLATVTDDAKALEDAFEAAQGGGVALTAVMHDKEDELDFVLTALGADVTYTANGDEAIILSAGMAVKKTAPRTSRTFSAEHTDVSGQVLLGTKAGKRSSYIWQQSSNPASEESWATKATTIQANFTVSGLTPRETVWFRVATVTKNGQGDWSDAISIIVI